MPTIMALHNAKPLDHSADLLATRYSRLHTYQIVFKTLCKLQCGWKKMDRVYSSMETILVPPFTVHQY